MAYDRFVVIDLGPSYAGAMDLRAQLRDAAGTAVNTELVVADERPGGEGIFTLTVASIPDEHIGLVDIYRSGTPSSVIFSFGIEPSSDVDLTAIQDAVAESNTVPTFHLNRGVPSIYELRKGLGYA